MRWGAMRTDYRIQHPHAEDDTLTPVTGEGQYFQTYIFLPKPGFPPPKGGDPFSRMDLFAMEASDSLGGLVWHLDKDRDAKPTKATRSSTT